MFFSIVTLDATMALNPKKQLFLIFDFGAIETLAEILQKFPRDEPLYILQLLLIKHPCPILALDPIIALG